ncbi:MAG: HAD-IIIC family phosphatase [Acidobacteriia bacterium]|nr:HAD-IIIC family phosphatase [Terriglobia bacterium]
METPRTTRGSHFAASNLLALSVVIPMLMSAALITGAIAIIERIAHPSWYFWAIVSPLIYIAWLMGHLAICALHSRRLGRRHPKPRRLHIQRGADRRQQQFAGFTVVLCMFRAAFNTNMPLVRGFEQIFWFRKLVLRSYAPSVHVGEGASVWSFILDPDLTEIGARAIIGWGGEFSSHVLTNRPDGSLVYASAPIKVGARTTIGAGCRVALGATIGADVIVEPMSHVAPFTNIPDGEIWGGVPARRLRARDDLKAEAETSDGTYTPGELDNARQLIIQALGLKDVDHATELTVENCPAWDSVGQIAIVTAIYDRHGINVEPDAIYHMRSVRDVAAVITGKIQNRPHADEELPRDFEMLPLLDPAVATGALSARFLNEPATSKPLRVVIGASSTAQPLAPTMKLWGRAFGMEFDIEFAGFNQVAQTLLSPTSLFAANADGVNIVLVDPSDRAFDSPGEAAHGAAELLSAIEAWASRQPTGAQTIVGTLPPQVSSFAALERSAYEQLRHEWRSRLEKLLTVQLFDFGAVVEQVGVMAARSSGNEVISRMPYSPTLYQALAIALVRHILATRRTPAKVIAVDCDSTLWGGVAGEVGLEGIELGADGAGRSFQLFQQQLKRLKERGLLLAVVSRNEAADVFRVFENHPGMVLGTDDIAAWRVNWKHKSENLEELAEELNVGTDSFVFLDDDQAVRMEVSMRLPGVHVVPLPEDPARYCETLERLWLFDGAQPTEADRKRTRMMQDETRRRSERTQAASLEEYLAGLKLQVEMRAPEENEWARVAQLTQRTNQFNLSLKRRTLEEVKALAETGPVLIIRARDRFGDYGLVGICFLLPAAAGACEIDTLLMSCRVLGRGVEDAFLHAIARTAAAAGASTVTATFIPGPRNQIIKDFLIRSGFVEVQPDRWDLPITRPPVLPAHIHWTGQERASIVSGMV